MSKFISLTAFTKFDENPIIIPINMEQVQYILPVIGYKNNRCELVFGKGDTLIVEEDFESLQTQLENL